MVGPGLSYYKEVYMTKDEPTIVQLEFQTSTPAELQHHTCERCGYKFAKVFDYSPILCYRCMRFIAKRVFSIMGQIQPPTSRPEVADL